MQYIVHGSYGVGAFSKKVLFMVVQMVVDDFLPAIFANNYRYAQANVALPILAI